MIGTVKIGGAVASDRVGGLGEFSACGTVVAFTADVQSYVGRIFEVVVGYQMIADRIAFDYGMFIDAYGIGVSRGSTPPRQQCS